MYVSLEWNLIGYLMKDQTLKTRSVTLLVFVLIIADVSSAQSITSIDSADTTTKNYEDFRGTVRKHRSADFIVRKIIASGLYIPRETIKGILQSTGKSASVISDEKFIAHAEDFFFVLDKRAGWFPSVVLSTGFAPYYGLNLFYRDDSKSIVLSGRYRNRYKSGWQAKYNQEGIIDEKVWKISFLALADRFNDQSFFGFGAVPQTDSRNIFKTGSEEFGRYFQKRIKYQAVFGIRPSKKLELFYTSYYQKRELGNSGISSRSVEDVFDVNLIPGFGVEGKQLYNEAAVKYDTRKFNKSLSSGKMFGGYLGYSQGVGGEKSKFLRMGFDVAAFIPVIKDNRIIVPRLIVDKIENIDDGNPISFVEYPRQRAFRGVSTRKLIATDNLSFIPSLQYEWPLSYRLTGQLFSDFIIVSEDLSSLTFDNARWAAGFGLVLHQGRSETGKFEIAYGSEGAKILFGFGSPLHNNERTDWK